MIDKYFKVTLLSDVVLNSKLATEGNMTTLEYIPGSNFLGIVAGQLYQRLKPNETYDIFHSGKVSFGNATISKDGELSYPVPFDYMMVKGEDKLGKHKIYLQHLLHEVNYPRDTKGFKKQLKQKRSGFITPSGKAITKIEKTFVLKSAYDSIARRSKEGAMFGFESLKKGQEFIFSVRFEVEDYVELVSKSLIGRKRVGKSKTAQYGQVEITSVGEATQIEKFESEYSLVYVQSNLCITDPVTGQFTFQPTAEDLGLNGEIDWSKSIIRSYSYSPWNGKRNTNDTLRTCIAAGSVLYVNGENVPGEKSIGAFQSEGLGRIIVNPIFLMEKENALCDFIKIEKENENDQEKKADVLELQLQTPLGKSLQRLCRRKQDDLSLSKMILEQYTKAIKKDGKGKTKFYKVTSNQWGAIRASATQAKTFQDLKNDLLEGSDAFLKRGVAYEKIWSNGQNLSNLNNIFMEASKSSNPSIFIAKFAAQMAKFEQKKEKNKVNDD